MCETVKPTELQEEIHGNTPKAEETLNGTSKNVLDTLDTIRRPTSNIDEHPSGYKPLSKDGKDCSKCEVLPEDEYYLKNRKPLQGEED